MAGPSSSFTPRQCSLFESGRLHIGQSLLCCPICGGWQAEISAERKPSVQQAGPRGGFTRVIAKDRMVR